MSKFVDWNNYDNQDFYAALDIKDFQKYALVAGLAECPDLKLIHPYIEKARTILEVGAGYGRVIDYLLTKKITATITGLEFCDNFLAILRERYKKTPNIKLIKQDIHDLHLDSKQDLVLWMWSGIADFTPIEQLEILRKLKSLLVDNGALVIDTLSEESTPLSTIPNEEKNAFVQQHKDKKVYICHLLNAELDQYARELSLDLKHLNYVTTTGRTRTLHIFTKIFM